MKKLLALVLACLAPLALATPPTSGQFVFQRKPSSGPYDLYGVTPVTSQAFGWNGSDVVMLPVSGGSGTVTSVGLAAPNIFIVSGSPVATTGTLTLTFANQSAHAVLVGPASGSAAVPGFRSLVASDIPSLSSVYALTGTATSSGLTMSTGKLLGRSTASTGAVEELTVGSGLTLSGGTLSASGGGGGALLAANNLSDLSDAAAARSNLGADTAYEAALGNPAGDTYYLTSNTSGMRQWVAPLNLGAPGTIGAETPGGIYAQWLDIPGAGRVGNDGVAGSISVTDSGGTLIPLRASKVTCQSVIVNISGGAENNAIFSDGTHLYWRDSVGTDHQLDN